MTEKTPRRLLATLLIAAACSLAACHSPPPELALARRRVVVLGPWGVEQERHPMGRSRYPSLAFTKLDPAACQTMCRGVAKDGERLTACYRLSRYALEVSAPTRPYEEPLTPSSAHLCTVE